MNNFLAVDTQILQYASKTISHFVGQDPSLSEEVGTFVTNLLALFKAVVDIRNVDLLESETLHSIIAEIKGNGLSNDAVVRQPFFVNVYERFQDEVFFKEFFRSAMKWIFSLPLSFLPSWLHSFSETVPSSSSPSESCEKLVDVQRMLRLLVQHSIPALSTHVLPMEGRLLILDYDGTITTQDTCSVGILGGDLFNNDGRSRAMEYQKLYEDFLVVYKSTFDQLIKAETLEDFLAGYHAMDVDSLEPVVKAGLFTGLKMYTVKLVSRLVELRENVSYAINHLVPLKDAYIVSQSWYKEMVIESLQHNVHYPVIPLPATNVYTSRVVYDEHGVGTGELAADCGGCLGKKRVMMNIVSERAPACTIVVGDGLGDLAMMLTADLPIVIQPGGSFRRVCERYDIQLIPLQEYMYERGQPVQTEKEKVKRVYVASGWSDIASVLAYSSAMEDPWTTESESTNFSTRCSAEQCRLMALTNDVLNEAGGSMMEHAVLESIRGGATMVQIRDKTENFDRMVEHANQLRSILAQKGVPLIINDRVDVAIVSEADGVHIGQHDMNAAICRRLLGPHKILGVSAQTVEQAIQAEKDGADYLGTGAVYPTISKDDADAVGVDGLRRVCEAVHIPVVSIGGVNAQNAGETIKAGAVGIAVISAIFNRPDICEASRELRDAVEKAL